MREDERGDLEDGPGLGGQVLDGVQDERAVAHDRAGVGHLERKADHGAGRFREQPVVGRGAVGQVGYVDRAAGKRETRCRVDGWNGVETYRAATNRKRTVGGEFRLAAEDVFAVGNGQDTVRGKDVDAVRRLSPILQVGDAAVGGGWIPAPFHCRRSYAERRIRSAVYLDRVRATVGRVDELDGAGSQGQLCAVPNEVQGIRGKSGRIVDHGHLAVHRDLSVCLGRLALVLEADACTVEHETAVRANDVVGHLYVVRQKPDARERHGRNAVSRARCQLQRADEELAVHGDGVA